MKKITILIGALVLMAFCAPLMAQSFTDVPTDHWAYAAIQELANKGYIVGYPDGTFGGKRAMTRYEFAMAISRVITQLAANTPAGGVSQQDFNALASRVSALENKPAVAGDFATKSDLDKVRRLVDEFRDELATLGVDVDALKRELADLRTRTEALEGVVSRMPTISADMNFIARGETTRSGEGPVFDADGRILSANNRILEGVRSLYDMDLTIKGKVTDKVTGTAVFNAGNYLNWLRTTGDVSIPAGAGLAPVPSPLDAPEQVSPWLIYANAPISLGPVGGADLTVGKMPFQLTPYTLRMIDVDSYTYNQKTDSGDYPMFGAAMNFKLGPVGLTTYAARHDTFNFPFLAGALGAPQGVFNGGVFVENDLTQSAGIRATVGTPFAGLLGLNYIQAGTSGAVAGLPANFDRMAIFGADLNATFFRGIGFTGSWTRSQWQDASGDTPAGWGDSDAWDARFDVPIGELNLQAGYRQVDPNFSAPGFWGKLGSIFNPVDIKGPLVNLTLPVTKKIAVRADGEFYTGTDKRAFDIAGPASAVDLFTKDQDIQRYQVGLKYALTSSNSVDLGLERVVITGTAPAGPALAVPFKSQDFVNIGVGHTFNPNTSLKLLYQFVREEQLSGVKNHGGVAVTQFSVKF